ncbi:MAG: hydrogenase formation protein HypD [Nitrospirae bacterium]|nr:hydrogenase formation protein HypD [Nitrospirota bacterium]
MKFIDEYREAGPIREMAAEIRKITTRSWTIMEVCGGQTHAIVKYGLDKMLPEKVSLSHGPGCPVCVTPSELIDKAIEIALSPGVIFCSFGDMLRVPGTKKDLLRAKGEGGDIRVVYSPLDALSLARKHPEKEIVFFAIGFETTAPAHAMAVYQASLERIKNFSILISHFLVPPAMEAILSSRDNRVQGFLAAGHVCAVMGYFEYEPIASRYRVPVVVTGFEPLDILQGVYLCIRQLEEGRAGVENQYLRAVLREGNIHARQMIEKVFEIVPGKWRGIGEILQSGLALRKEFARYDAEGRFGPARDEVRGVTESPDCISGLVLQGIRKPEECSSFGRSCTPDHPAGATMVSSEGACAAYYRYR